MSRHGLRTISEVVIGDVLNDVIHRGQLDNSSLLIRNSFTGMADVGLLLLPGFDLHDLSCLSDTLMLCNEIAGKSVFSTTRIGVTPKPVMSSSGISVMPELLIGDVDQALNLVVISGYDKSPAETRSFYHWLRERIHSNAVLGAVGGGCRVLATARILEDKVATAHWDVRHMLQQAYRDTQFLDRMFMIDDRIVTCSGYDGTLDLALHCVAENCGNGAARLVADRLNCEQLRDRGRRQGCSAPNVLIGLKRPIRMAITAMSQHIEDVRSTNEIAERIGICVRQLQRLFKQYCGMTPNNFYRAYRLYCARHLLRQTDLMVAEIAAATGFISASHFSGRYFALFGRKPSVDRLTGQVAKGMGPNSPVEHR